MGFGTIEINLVVFILVINFSLETFKKSQETV